MTNAVETLSRRLLPWLSPVLAKLEMARRAGGLGHAWLISGPAGVGKVNLALVLARRLLGEDAEPAILDPGAAIEAMAARHEPVDRHPDLHWLYPQEDKETISIEQVRDLASTLTLTAYHRGGAKVALIEPAEALTAAAANALLKTLEEPTPGSYLLLLSHQPGRLAATIRSRCQHVAVAVPEVATLAPWLGVSPAAAGEARRSAGPAPLSMAAAVQSDKSRLYNTLYDDLSALCQDRLDPQAVAQAWVKADAELALSWLTRRLHDEIRSRLAQAERSTEVTVPGEATLHNAWRALPTRTLFDAYDRAERMLNLLGSGLNVELALAATLNALVVNRGRS